MDLIKIELLNIDNELNKIYQLRKNQRNHKKIILLKQRQQDLMFRQQMTELENTDDVQENDEPQNFYDNNFEGITLFEDMPVNEEVRFRDDDVAFLTSIVESNARISRLNKRCKFKNLLNLNKNC